jgi:DNA-binding response OmpR family regulator
MTAVFLVDDDDNYRELVQLTLQDACGVACVHAFRRAGDLLGHLERQAPDGPGLVVSDLHMPGVGGLELLQRIRQRHPGLPVAILSAALDDAQRQACLDAGAAVAVLKPLAYAELVATLHGLLRLTPAQAAG